MKQIQSHFLIALKTYSISLFLFTCLLFTACPKQVKEEVSFKPSSIPPWQTWSTESYGNLDMQQAVISEARGELDVASKFYELAFQSANSEALKEEAYIRLIGNNLKQGLSEQILKQVSWYSEKNNIALEKLRPRIALVVAHAYLHKNEVDQMLAWFSIAKKNVQIDSLFSQNIDAQIQAQIGSLNENEFSVLEQRWYTDRIIGPFFTRERLRRARGGQAMTKQVVDWFSASTYRTRIVDQKVSGELSETELVVNPDFQFKQTSNSGFISRVAVMLPLSGEYKDFSTRVLEGIKIALSDSTVELQVYDTEADANRAAELCSQIIKQGGVDVVLGPLLVKSTEAVAKSCDSYGVPFISFSKQAGIPELGQNIYRLGATVESQVLAILKYANQNLALRRFAILYPQNPSGDQLAAEFRKQMESFPGVLLAEASYVSGNDDSITRAVNVIESSPVEAIFVADSLESAFPALQIIKESELLKNIQIIGPAYWDDPVAAKGYGQLTDGAIYVSLFFLNSKTDSVRDFVSAYYDANDQEPELLAAQGYDAAMLVRRVFNLDSRRGNFASDFKSLGDFRGVTGLLSIKDNGEIEREASIIRLKRGKASEVYRAR